MIGADFSNYTASRVHDMCNKALNNTYEGYKGGDYTYSQNTPLVWQ